MEKAPSDQTTPFSQPYGNIYSIEQLPDSMTPVLLARNSRTGLPLQTVYQNEFAVNGAARAEDFCETVLVDYGDDSVQELHHLSLQVSQCSTLLAKRLERARVGISFIEKSTRYIDFSKKGPDGHYAFYRGKELQAACPEYFDILIETSTMLFDKYVEWLNVLKEEIRASMIFPADTKEKTKDSVIRTTALDALRTALPAGTLTNVGMVGNALALERLCLKLQASEMGEFRECGENLKALFQKESPQFFKRCDPAKSKFAKEFVEYYRECSRIRDAEEDDVRRNRKEKSFTTDEFQVHIMPSYRPLGRVPIAQLVDRLPLQLRTNRRFPPPREFEHHSFKFLIMADYKVWCDLQRHRLTTMNYSLLTNAHGFVIPKLIEISAIRDDYVSTMEKVSEIYDDCMSRLAVPCNLLQYLLPMGFKLTWMWEINLREMFHILELRTGPQGHPSYRRVCQEMYRQIHAQYPGLTAMMNHVNMEEETTGRLEAEKKAADRENKK